MFALEKNFLQLLFLRTARLLSRVLALSLCLLAVVPTAGHSQSSISDEELKAAYIFNFIKNIEWPNESSIEKFSVAFYGQDTGVEEKLRSGVRGKLVRGKKISVERVRDIANVGKFQVVFLESDDRSVLTNINDQITGDSVLLVTDRVAVSQYIMINFVYPDEQRIAFEVHRPNIVAENLKILPELLLLGGTELDVAELFKASEQAITQLRESLAAQKRELSSVTDTLREKTIEIEVRKAELQEKSSEVTAVQSQLNELTKSYQSLQASSSSLNNELAEREKALEEVKLQLQRRQFLIEQRQQYLEKTELDISENKKTMELQEFELSQLQSEIDRQSLVLTERTTELKKQQRFLVSSYWVIGVLSVLVVLVLVLLLDRGRQLERFRAVNTNLESMTKELKQAMTAKDRFLSTMSHEIRTPLNGIIGLIDVLMDRIQDTESKKYLRTIHSSGDLLLSVINDILDFSKLEADRVVVEKVPFKVSRIITECADIFSIKASDRNMEFCFYIDPATPARLIGDPTRIKQVLVNLLSNAFKFTEQGEIVVSVEWDHAGLALFRVRDTGIGIQTEKLHRVFESFVQEDDTTTRRYGGTGLGLAICQRLVNLMGGEIGVESEADKGSEFWFRVPLTVFDKRPFLTPEPGLDNVPVWVVENRLFCRTTLCKYLQAWGCTVKSLDNLDMLSEAIECAPKNLIDSTVLLLNESLFQQGGEVDLQLGNLLRRTKFKKLILIQNNYYGSGLPGGLNDRVDKRITKPFTSSQLHEALTENPLEKFAVEVVEATNLFNGMHVLVAEDNPVNQMVIRTLLDKLSIISTIVDDGLKAVTAYRDRIETGQKPFFMILMDCEMPNMDGFQATKAIRGMESPGERIPIVALTAHALKESRDQAMHMGMDGYLCKPIKLKEIQTEMSKFLEGPDRVPDHA